MLRKLPSIVQTPFVPGVPGRAEQVVCPVRPGDPSVHVPPYRPQYEQWQLCHYPEMTVTMPDGSRRTITASAPVCVTAWRSVHG